MSMSTIVGNHRLFCDVSNEGVISPVLKCYFDDDDKQRGHTNEFVNAYLLSARDQTFLIITSNWHVYRILKDYSLVRIATVSSDHLSIHFLIKNLGLFLLPKMNVNNKTSYKCVDHHMKEFGELTLDYDTRYTATTLETICGNYALFTVRSEDTQLKLFKIIKSASQDLVEFQDKTEILSSAITQPIVNPSFSHYNSIAGRFIIVVVAQTIQGKYTLMTIDILTRQQKIHFDIGDSTSKMIFLSYKPLEVSSCEHSIVTINNQPYFFDQANVEFVKIDKHDCCEVMVPLHSSKVQEIYAAIFDATHLPGVCIDIILDNLNLRLSY